MAQLASAHRPPPAAPAGPAAAGPLRKLSFPALGTRCEVQYYLGGTDPRPGQAFEQEVVAWVQAFEARYTRFRPDSLIGRINAAAGQDWVAIDAEMEGMLQVCDTLHFMTQGVLDPTSLPLQRLWDYQAPVPRLPTDAEIERARALVGWKKVARAPGRIFLPAAGWPSISADSARSTPSIEQSKSRVATAWPTRWWTLVTTCERWGAPRTGRLGTLDWKTRLAPALRRAVWPRWTGPSRLPATISATWRSRAGATGTSWILGAAGRSRTAAVRPPW